MAEGEFDLIDRPRGILTRQERKHLWGKLDEDHEDDADAIRQREYRIRQHLRNAILDFQILSGAINPNMHKVFSRIGVTGETAQHDWPLENGVEALFEFLFFTLGNTDKNEYSSFERLLKDGVESALVRAYASHGISVTPQVSLLFKTGTHVPLDDVKRAFENGEDFILVEEQDALYWSGRITHEERMEHRDKIDRLLDEGEQEELDGWAEKTEVRRAEAAVEVDDSLLSFVTDDE